MTPAVGEIAKYDWADRPFVVIRAHKVSSRIWHIASPEDDPTPGPNSSVDATRCTKTDLEISDEASIDGVWCGDAFDTRELSDSWAGETVLDKLLNHRRGMTSLASRVNSQHNISEVDSEAASEVEAPVGIQLFASPRPRTCGVDARCCRESGFEPRSLVAARTGTHGHQSRDIPGAQIRLLVVLGALPHQRATWQGTAMAIRPRIATSGSRPCAGILAKFRRAAGLARHHRSKWHRGAKVAWGPKLVWVRSRARTCQIFCPRRPHRINSFVPASTARWTPRAARRRPRGAMAEVLSPVAARGLLYSFACRRCCLRWFSHSARSALCGHGVAPNIGRSDWTWRPDPGYGSSRLVRTPNMGGIITNLRG